MNEKFKPEEKPKMTSEERDEYIRIAMEWSKRKFAEDEEGARPYKEKLLLMEKRFNMTREEIINSKSV